MLECGNSYQLVNLWNCLHHLTFPTTDYLAHSALYRNILALHAVISATTRRIWGVGGKMCLLLNFFTLMYPVSSTCPNSVILTAQVSKVFSTMTTFQVCYNWVMFNWFLMMPSIVTKFQYVNFPFLFFYDGIIRNQLDRCATGCNTQRKKLSYVAMLLYSLVAWASCFSLLWTHVPLWKMYSFDETLNEAFYFTHCIHLLYSMP
jgi:hypothetical protein